MMSNPSEKRSPSISVILFITVVCFLGTLGGIWLYQHRGKSLNLGKNLNFGKNLNLGVKSPVRWVVDQALKDDDESLKKLRAAPKVDFKPMIDLRDATLSGKNIGFGPDPMTQNKIKFGTTPVTTGPGPGR